MSVSLTSPVTSSPATPASNVTAANGAAAKIGSAFKDALDKMLQGMATGTATHAGIRPDQSGGTLDGQARTGHSVSLKV
jgi:hypothetical protein